MEIFRPNLKLKIALIEKGSQVNACRVLDIQPSYLSGIIGGYVKPSLELKQKISDYLKKPLNEIFPKLCTDTDKPNSQM